jgi:hypothetical protein
MTHKKELKYFDKMGVLQVLVCLNVGYGNSSSLKVKTRRGEEKFILVKIVKILESCLVP